MPTPLRPKRKRSKIFFLLTTLASLVGAGIAIYQHEFANSPARHHTLTFNELHQQHDLLDQTLTLTLHAEESLDAPSAVTEALLLARQTLQTCADDLARFNSTPANKWLPCSPPFLEVLAYAREAADLSILAYNPATSGSPLAIEVNFTKKSARRLQPNLTLDLTHITQGYALDQILATLKKRGIHSAHLTLGNHHLCSDPPPNQTGWTLPLHDQNQQVTATIVAKNTALTTHFHAETNATVLAPRTLMTAPLSLAASKNPDFFAQLSSETNIHSRILLPTGPQTSPGFPTITPIQSKEPLAIPNPKHTSGNSQPPE
ncbi:MAG: FAD:protein FMN transferase [Verrucomicrobiota bacterium]